MFEFPNKSSVDLLRVASSRQLGVIPICSHTLRHANVGSLRRLANSGTVREMAHRLPSSVLGVLQSVAQRES
jgi:hypothetical protein